VRGAQQELHELQLDWQQLFCLQHLTFRHFGAQQLLACASESLMAMVNTATTTAASDNSLRVIAFSPFELNGHEH